MSITWVTPVKKWLNKGYPGLSLVILESHAGISLHIPSYTELYPPGISRDIPFRIPILGYPNTSFVDCVIKGYPGIKASSSYPRISRDNSGYAACHFSRWRKYLVLQNRSLVSSKKKRKKEANQDIFVRFEFKSWFLSKNDLHEHRVFHIVEQIFLFWQSSMLLHA